VGSLSKTVSAALRFGYVACPVGLGEAGRLTAQHGFFALSRPVEELCLSLFRSGLAAEIRAKVQTEFERRLTMMVNRLGFCDLHWQPGLPFAWLNLPRGWRASAFAREAESQGILVRPADEYAMVTGRAPNAVRLSVGGLESRERFEAALVTLAELLARPPSDLAV
jgi:DNA-binding transcriptional MocR family regulator